MFCQNARASQETVMPDWSIKIVPVKGKPGIFATFTPDIDGSKPGQPLKVVQGDLVSWNNTTTQQHWPVPDDPQTYGDFIAGPIDPDSSSSAYNIVATAGATINYHCRLHPE